MTLSDCAHPQGCPPTMGTCPPKQDTTHTCPSSQAGQDGILSPPCTAGPGASPAPAQADPDPKLIGSTVCPTLVPMSFLWGWPWMEPPGHQRNLWPLTAVLISCPGPACSFLPKQESRSKAWLSSPCHEPGLKPPSSSVNLSPHQPGSSANCS